MAAGAATSGWWPRSNQASLLGFRDHPHRRATDGAHGSGKRRHGGRGPDLEVPVPVGTVVRDRDGARLCDLSGPGDRWLAAEGGRGGRGNARFLSNKRRAPAFAEQGEKGEERWLDLELKLAADVALVGFPNAGKSTLIAAVSAAKPKVADYPFTTLEPHLGVVRTGGRPGDDEVEFVMADIPGLVEGAAEGRGLGHRFLRHVERSRVLVVLVDLAAPDGRSADDQVAVLLGELVRYRPDLLERPRVVVGSKADLASGPLAAGQDRVELRISAATRAGLGALVGRLATMVARARTAEGALAPTEILVHRPAPEGVRVTRQATGVWRVAGRAAERAVSFSDLTDDGALAESVIRLKRLGVDRALARAGAHDGDEVQVGEVTFTWWRDGADALVDPAPEAGRRGPGPGGRRRRGRAAGGAR